MPRTRSGRAAARAIVDRYFDRLARLARSRLAASLAARTDPEDVVQSAYRSFFVRARGGEFAVVRGGDLWRLLAAITLHKVHRQHARHLAQRRSVRKESPLAEEFLPPAAAADPTPAEGAALAEELQALAQGSVGLAFKAGDAVERGKVIEARASGESEQQAARSVTECLGEDHLVVAVGLQQLHRRVALDQIGKAGELRDGGGQLARKARLEARLIDDRRSRESGEVYGRTGGD